jgi:hypothetical protein
VRKVLTSWGPGKFDDVLDKDGKAFRPDGKPAATLIPPAFGLAGVNLATWTGFGSVTYWNAYVAATEMHGSGMFFDDRLKDSQQFPVAARSESWNTRGKPDQITGKLTALHFYQLAIPAPAAPLGSYDKAAAARGGAIFNGKAKCATCHVPPLYTEPGQNLHAPAEIGVDSFQADRSPTRAYRTTAQGPLDSPEGRLLSRRPIRGTPRGRRPLQRTLPAGADSRGNERSDRAPQGALIGRLAGLRGAHAAAAGAPS